LFNNQEGEKHFRQVQSNVDFSLLGLSKAQTTTQLLSCTFMWWSHRKLLMQANFVTKKFLHIVSILGAH
jgi:hypothetical protein